MTATSLGFPRIGARRELKTALERFWSGQADEASLRATAAALRHRHWALQREAGIDTVPCGDFSLYDHVLDTACAVGAIPPGYGWRPGEPVSLETYFALARGRGGQEEGCGCGHEHGQGTGLPALDMTKWFDTNYHNLTPVFRPGQDFAPTGFPAVESFEEARQAGFAARPVLLGPVSFLLLGRMAEGDGDPLDLLPGLLPVYAETLRRLAAAGARWVQMDEPCLVLDLGDKARAAYQSAYQALAGVAPPLSLLLTTYFGGLRDNLDLALRLPVEGLHLDLVRAPEQLAPALRAAPARMVLSLGLVDGRNVWRTDLRRAFGLLREAAANRRPEALLVAPSCSLLHSPIDLEQETALDPELRGWMAFARQKLEEVAILARGLREGPGTIEPALRDSDARQESRRASPRLHDPAVAARLAAGSAADATRQAPFPERQAAQRARLRLPPYPTTSIGSLPQTAEIRAARARFRRGELDEAGYEDFLRGRIVEAIRWQEEAGIDMPVHGEFERNDMVEHFAEHLSGYAVTKHGWVQSYGSRCVKPPILYGDVSRPAPMTVRWSAYAQSLTARPVKGMLTGPVTMMQWAFVRDDIPAATVRRQLAYALRDEVVELEAAGIAAVQIDEPAIREGLPLRRADREAYLHDAVECFRIAASGVGDATQIHTHMCYSEFNDIIGSIAAMDADVISIETARSRMALLEAFADFRYPNEIGPGVWDIHSPRVPEAEEMRRLLLAAAQRIPADRLWVNPDCGLKTRRWEEVRPAIANMVAAARTLRAQAAE
ncbi:5-methyltetrahydropteroyltriglutamate--homocysteine S-methyltransferase [Roseomonas gilardii subsp. gilardii]|uniref:5-methyltetrahydropteroyltriglutamate-- homocysteine S-methyltransferase n=1 Tax=Roseomonas gilardii TaxID=257708 RepID=UPI001FF91879|nr:5-methyltetrahydropteroyltriglutamate--homocysteine S-methyltransferase [Roseomonas gilardii]UPG72068.1 5-methyltetrahydropteroyltriglutamate--homocysteine S-methyltransferase [Roseomonas gilardii subsp. gilardii]